MFVDCRIERTRSIYCIILTGCGLSAPKPVTVSGIKAPVELTD